MLRPPSRIGRENNSISVAVIDASSTLLVFITQALILRRPLLRRPKLPPFLELPRSNSYNAGPFNAASPKLTPLTAGVKRANKV